MRSWSDLCSETSWTDELLCCVESKIWNFSWLVPQKAAVERIQYSISLSSRGVSQRVTGFEHHPDVLFCSVVCICMTWDTRRKSARCFRRDAVSWNVGHSKICGTDAPALGNSDLSQLLLDEEMLNEGFSESWKDGVSCSSSSLEAHSVLSFSPCAKEKQWCWLGQAHYSC